MNGFTIIGWLLDLLAFLAVGAIAFDKADETAVIYLFVYASICNINRVFIASVSTKAIGSILAREGLEKGREFFASMTKAVNEATVTSGILIVGCIAIGHSLPALLLSMSLLFFHWWHYKTEKVLTVEYPKFLKFEEGFNKVLRKHGIHSEDGTPSSINQLTIEQLKKLTDDLKELNKDVRD